MIAPLLRLLCNFADADLSFLAESICVGGVRQDYVRMPSTYGREVDILAPGERLFTTSWAGGSENTSVTGTSFAAPLVAGVAAIFVSWEGLAGGDVKPYLQNNALKGVCSNVPKGQPNLLLNTGILNPTARAENEPFVGGSDTAAPWNEACRVHEGPFAVGGPRNPRPE